MEEVKSWFEVPSIAHFCSLFRAAFDLPDFDIEDLENGLQAFGEELESPFIIDLICRLLRGCYNRVDIESFNYEVYLKDIFKYRATTGEQKTNPFQHSDFKSLDLRAKVEVLYQLCDYRLDAEDVMDQLKGLDGDNMRVSPLGSDDSGASYWYFYGNRLYKEDVEPTVQEDKLKKKKKEKDKEKNKSKSRKGGTKKKKEEETPRSRRGRILSKRKKFESSESSEEEVDEEESDREEYVTPAKQLKSEEGPLKGRKSRSTSRNKKPIEPIEEETKSIGTRRSSRRSTAQSTPVPQKENRKGQKTAAVYYKNMSDEDSDEEWNTPLSKTIFKTTASRRGNYKGRNPSVDNSDKEEEELETKTKKKGRPRKAVKITPDSSVNGEVQDQNMNDVMENDDSGIEDEPDMVTTASSSQGSSIEIAQTVNNEIAEKNSCQEDHEKEEKMDTENFNEQKLQEIEIKEPKMESEQIYNVKDVVDGKQENDKAVSIEADIKHDISNDILEDAQTNGISEDNAAKEEFKDELNVNPETQANEVKTENDNELNVLDVNSEADKEIEKPATQPLYKNPRWHLVCETLEEWDTLAAVLKESTTKSGKELYKCLANDFLPEIPAILEARERDRRKRQAEMAPRRVSARITMKMKEFQEQEKILEQARQLEEQTMREEEEERERLRELERQEEERKLREERQRAREERQRRLEQREVRAQLLAEGKEIPPELMYTGNTFNSKYREEDDRIELDKETLDDMEKMLEEVKGHKDSWPFLDPVEEEIAPGYHDIIKKPMDLSSIEKKLKNQGYRTTKRFMTDFNLMISNCFQFSGADSELGRMATRLKKYILKCIKIYIDKTDEDEDDEDYHTGVMTQTEKKWRPRRAATCRAMDTIRGAFDDDKFEEMTSTPQHEYASSSRKKRLIPELSGDTNTMTTTTVVNGERTVGRSDSNNPNSVSRIWAESTDTTKETKILTVNGKTFVYKFNTVTNAKKKIIEKPAFSISNSPDKSCTNNIPNIINTATNSIANGSPRVIVKPPPSGNAILPVSTLPASTMSTTATINTPNGPKIIRIMSPHALSQETPTQAPVPQLATAGTTPSKAIRISDGMLLLDGKPTGIQISGKTKIIYRGAVPGGQAITTGKNPIVVASADQPRPSNPAIIQSTVGGQVIASQCGIQPVQVATSPAMVYQGCNQTITEQLIANVPAAISAAGQVMDTVSTIGSRPAVTGHTALGSQAVGQTFVISKSASINATQSLLQTTTVLSSQQINAFSQPSVVSSTILPSPSIKTIQPSPAIQSVNNVSKNSSVCLGTSGISLLSSPNQKSTFSPYVSAVKSSPVATSDNQDLDMGHIQSINVHSPVKRTEVFQISPSQLSTLPSNDESLMGPPLLVPPKRKLSSSPDNHSILPPKLNVIGSPTLTNVNRECDNNEDKIVPPTLTYMGSSLLNSDSKSRMSAIDGSLCDKNNLSAGQHINSFSDCEKFPPYKVSHSTSPDKGNLFEILKTNLTGSVSSESDGNNQTADLNQSGLSKVMMDQVSTFAASLQSKNLAGKINIPAQLLQKSPTKDGQSQEESHQDTSSIVLNTDTQLQLSLDPNYVNNSSL